MLAVTTVLLGLAYSASAIASYHEGAYGVFTLYQSIPFAVLGALLSSWLAHYGLFRWPHIFALYCAIWTAVWIGVLNFATRINEPESTMVLAVGGGILIILILLPAITQFAKRNHRD